YSQYSGAANEEFKAISESGGSYEFQGTQSGLCLTAPSTSNGTQLDITSCNGGSSQLWKLVTP
ncbi:MAG: RICIN domain-containing protein, partial [Terracidiphilus sp.]